VLTACLSMKEKLIPKLAFFHCCVHGSSSDICALQIQNLVLKKKEMVIRWWCNRRLSDDAGDDQDTGRQRDACRKLDRYKSIDTAVHCTVPPLNLALLSVCRQKRNKGKTVNHPPSIPPRSPESHTILRLLTCGCVSRRSAGTSFLMAHDSVPRFKQTMAEGSSSRWDMAVGSTPTRIRRSGRQSMFLLDDLSSVRM
jgi:hypothetical protein